MSVRYITTTSILNGKPGDACVHDDADDRWIIVVGTPAQSKRRTEGAMPIVKDLIKINPQASLADVLEAYIGNHSYSRASGWTDSPEDFGTTAQRLSEVILGR